MAKLREKITLQKINKTTSGTTAEMFHDVVETRASIVPMYKSDDLLEVFEVILLKPPSCFECTQISSIKWNNKEYKCHSAFRSYGPKFLKGTIAG
jgi:hypothetical protein